MINKSDFNKQIIKQKIANLQMEPSTYHTPASHIKKSFNIESFDKFFLHSAQNFAQLSKIIKECNIDDIHCRFNVWRLCLGVVNVNSTQAQKRQQITQARLKYNQKKQEALKSFNKKSPIKEPVKKNPLLMMGGSKPTENKEVESDQFLKEQIHKDVERTYQQMKFFQDKIIQKLLNLLLFVWCRRNPDVSYKQGMNELLASVVVCYFKQAEFKRANDKPEQVSEELWASHLFFNSVQHIQSDIYSVFQKIIEIQGEMYKTEADVSIKSKVNPNSKNNTPILQRIMQIKDHKLKHMDLQLFRILKLQDVQTKSFMLRWIRCMHTREFDLDNSFVIWDSIFLEYLQSDNSKKNKQFEFIDAMCLSMFMYMRSIVFTKETPGQILQVYQKYPTLKRGVYLDELITLAWTICQELRLDNQNNQSTQNQSNWFEQSSKVKALHFMQKKAAQKKESEIKHQPVKKNEPVEKQLKQTDHKKHPETHKKHSDSLQHVPSNKTKQTGAHHSEGSGNIHHENNPKKQEKQKIKVSEQPKQKKQKSDQKDKLQSHKSQPVLEKQPVKQLTKNTSIQQSIKPQLLQKKQTPKQVLKQPVHPVKHAEPKLPIHSPLTNKDSSHHSSKPSQSTVITLSAAEITQILQNLNQSLPKIRDIDAQSLIRRTIKKIQGKVKTSKENEQNQTKKKESSKDENGLKIQNISTQNHSSQAEK